MNTTHDIKSRIRKAASRRDKHLVWRAMQEMREALENVVENEGDAFSLDSASEVLQRHAKVRKEI